MVVIKPMLMLNSFWGILDMLIMRNEWERVLLFSGHDGFDFYDDEEARHRQKCRVLFMSNKSNNDVHCVKITTNTVLTTATNQTLTYDTENFTKLLRGGEEIVIRIWNQEQYNKILRTHKDKQSSEVRFTCKMEYLTSAGQQICYEYAISIKDDRRIEVLADKYEVVATVTLTEDINPTVFRNLQDSISSIDRNAYTWRRIGEAQMQGMSAALQPSQVTKADEKITGVEPEGR